MRKDIRLAMESEKLTDDEIHDDGIDAISESSNEDSNHLDGLIESANSLESISLLLRRSGGIGLESHTVSFIGSVMDQVESKSGVAYPRRSPILSLEGIGDWLRAIWAKIKEFLSKIGEWIMQFVNWVTSFFTKSDVKEKAKKIKAHKKPIEVKA